MTPEPAAPVPCLDCGGVIRDPATHQAWHDILNELRAEHDGTWT